MGSKTGISWANSTWNPVVGCTPISIGCENCYARRMVKRFPSMTGIRRFDDECGDREYQGIGWDNRAHSIRTKLDQPFRWKKPRNIFVVSMGDLFHKDVEDEFIRDVYQTMLKAYWHHYFVLTKRECRMKNFLDAHSNYKERQNIHHGVSVCTREEIARVGVLCGIEGIRRFVSFEPLLEIPRVSSEFNEIELAIIGGESGINARRFPLEGSRTFINDLLHHKCCVFFKQLGSALAKEMGLRSRNGGKIDEWPEEFRIQEYPQTGIQVF
jgi:protein gp37